MNAEAALLSAATAAAQRASLEAAGAQLNERQKNEAEEDFCFHETAEDVIEMSEGRAFLTLSGRGLMEVPETLSSRTGLQSLCLSKNLFKSLPPGFSQLKALHTLSLYSNRLQTLPDCLWTLSSLETLMLGKNRIELIPPGIAHLQQLVTLDLSENKLTGVPAELACLPRLSHIALDSNDISEAGQLLPLEQCVNLGTLDLEGNPLPRRLRVNIYNDRQELEAWAKSLHLFNFGSGIHEACFAGDMKRVFTLVAEKGSRVLDALNREAMTPLHKACMGGQVAIAKFLLAQGAMTQLVDDQGRTPLEVACLLEHNEIVDCLLPFTRGQAFNFDKLSPSCVARVLQGRLFSRTVVKLSIFEAGVVWIPAEETFWRNFVALEELDLRRNKLQTVPAGLIRASCLERVFFHENPLRDIPAAFRGGDWHQLRKFLLTIREESTRWKERKLLLVGQEGVGKTTLLRALKEGGRVRCDINISTNGMKVERGLRLHMARSFPSFNLRQTVSTFSAFDLGGQEVLYPTHQFFLTSNSVYLVVFDLTTVDENFGRLEYWVEQIKASASNSSRAPIVLVGTHLDDEHCSDTHVKLVCSQLLRRFPKNRFRGIVRKVFCVSSATGEGIPSLQNCVDELAARLQPIVSPHWHRVHKRIHRLRKDWIPLSTLQTIAGHSGVSNAEVPMMLRFLVDIGSVIWFGDEEGALNEIVVLNPQWLSDFMSCWVNMKELCLDKDGVLSSNKVHLALLWKDAEKFPKETHAQLISLLERFNIVHRMSNGNLLVPSVLPISQPLIPTDLWPALCPKGYVEQGHIFDFPFLPLGFFGRLLARMFYLDDDVELPLFWNGGAVAKLHDQVALVKYAPRRLDQPVYRVALRVRVPVHTLYTAGALNSPSLEARLLIVALVDLVEHVIDCFYPNLKESLTEWIPCYHCKANKRLMLSPHLFSYSDLVQELLQGNLLVYCHGIRCKSRQLRIDVLAPDITFSTVALLAEQPIIEGKIGSGSFGTVWKCSWGGKKVAVKELTLPDGSSVEHGMSGALKNAFVSTAVDSFREFQREAAIMSGLRHPNIVGFHGIVGDPFRLVMEYVPEGDLSKLLRRRLQSPKISSETPEWQETGIQIQQVEYESLVEEVPWELRLRVALDVAKGMRYLSSLDPPIIHRDLRSPNIFIVSKDPSAEVVAKIGDFGLSTRAMPRAGGILPTYTWLAPEVFSLEGDEYDCRSDIYSFGIVLWELVTGDLPFSEYSLDTWDLKTSICDHDLRPSIPNSVPDAYRDLVLRCWLRNPAMRPSFEEATGVLARLLGNDSLSTDPRIVEERPPQQQESIDVISGEQAPRCDEPTHEPGLGPKYSLMSGVVQTGGAHCMVQTSGTHLWVGGADGSMAVYSLVDGEREAMALEERWQGHQGRVTGIACAFVPAEDGSTRQDIWTASEDGSIRVWDGRTQEQVWESAVRYPVTGLAIVFPPSRSAEVWTVSPSETFVKIWNTATRCVQTLSLASYSTAQEPLVITCLKQHGSLVLVGAQQWMFLIDADSRKIEGYFGAHEEGTGIRGITSVVGCTGFSSTVASFPMKEPVIKCWDITPPSNVRSGETLASHTSKVNCVCAVPDEEGGDGFLWTGSYDGVLILFSLVTMHPVAEISLSKQLDEVPYCILPLNLAGKQLIAVGTYLRSGAGRVLLYKRRNDSEDYIDDTPLKMSVGEDLRSSADLVEQYERRVSRLKRSSAPSRARHRSKSFAASLMP